MITVILIMSIAFLWLLIETKGLAIRLPQYYRKTTEIDITPLLIYATAIICEFVVAFTPKDKNALKFLGRLINKLQGNTLQREIKRE